VVFSPDSAVDGGTTSCRVDQLLAVLYRLLFVSLTYAHYALANRNLRGEGVLEGAGRLMVKNPHKHSKCPEQKAEAK